MTLIEKLKTVIENKGIVPKTISGLDYPAVIGSGYPKGHELHGQRIGIELLEECLDELEGKKSKK